MSGLPSTGRISLMYQESESRYVLHLLYANTINRGGAADLHGGNASGTQQSYEVIEDLLPLHDLDVELKLESAVKSVRLQPTGEMIEFTQIDGLLSFRVPKLLCHQIVVLECA